MDLLVGEDAAVSPQQAIIGSPNRKRLGRGLIQVGLRIFALYQLRANAKPVAEAMSIPRIDIPRIHSKLVAKDTIPRSPAFPSL